jgi:hypothetical protein
MFSSEKALKVHSRTHSLPSKWKGGGRSRSMGEGDHVWEGEEGDEGGGKDEGEEEEEGEKVNDAYLLELLEGKS